MELAKCIFSVSVPGRAKHIPVARILHPKKELKTRLIDFTFSLGMGFYHVGNSFYLGGGTFNYSEFLSKFRKLKPNRECTQLEELPIPKVAFAMAHWRQKHSLFTLGG